MLVSNSDFSEVHPQYVILFMLPAECFSELCWQNAFSRASLVSVTFVYFCARRAFPRLRYTGKHSGSRTLPVC